MFKSNRISKYFLLSFIGAFVFASCSEDSNVIFDPDWEGEPDPVITQVDPESSAYAGIGSVTPDGLEPVTIFGENFGTNADDVLIYFGRSRAQVRNFQSDRIQVTPPDDPGAERRIRLVRMGSEKYSEYPSETEHYELRSIYNPFPGFEEADAPQAITTDFNGDLIAVNIKSDEFDGVLRMDREGERENVIDAESWSYYKLRHGTDQALYKTRGGTIPIIYRTEAGETEPTPIVGPQPALGGNRTRLQDLEFDQDDYLWAGGRNGTGANADILRIDLSQDDIEIERFRFEGDINALRVYDGDLYVGAIREEEEVAGVWRLPIQPDHSLGEEELFVEMPDEAYQVRDIIFTVRGDMVLATNTKESVMIYRDNQLEELYPGVVPHGARDFAVSSVDPAQLLVNIIGMSLDGVSTQTQVLVLEMEQEMVPIYGTF